MTEIYKLDQERKTEASKKQIDQLNTDFRQIKDKLQQYLIKEELSFNDKHKKSEPNYDRIARSIGSKMYKNVELRECSEDYKDGKVAEKYEQLKSSYLKFQMGQEIDRYHENIFRRLYNGFSEKELKN